MSEELDLLKEVASRLENAGIHYMITGSMAMAIYSAPRMTRDIDIVIQVNQKDIEHIIRIFEKDFYIDEHTVRQAIKNRAMFNIIHDETIIKIDFIIRKDEEYRIEEFSRRQYLDVGGIHVSLVAPEDLILSKLLWARDSGSDLQLRDAQNMIYSTNLDKDYLSHWSQKLGVAHMLRKVSNNE